MSEASLEAMIWTEFRDRVHRRFCPTSAINKAERDFLDLKKESMSLSKFNSAFLEKMQFALKYCEDEASKVHRYVEALPPNYRSTVRGKATLEEAMEEARLIDRDLIEAKNVVGTGGGGGDKKRKVDEGNGSGFKKNKSSDFKRSERHNGEVWCGDCKSKHSGPCTQDTRACRNCNQKGHMSFECKNDPFCYACRETGHISRNCPKAKIDGGKKVEAPKAKARVFQLTAEEAVGEV